VGATVEELKKRGISFLNEKPLQYPSVKVVLVHPKSMGGILIELCERTQ